MEYKEVQFLENLIKELVDKPESVKINRKVDEMGVLLTVDVDPIDVGKIIGRQGNIAKAIRLLLGAVGYKHKVKASMKVNQP